MEKKSNANQEILESIGRGLKMASMALSGLFGSKGGYVIIEKEGCLPLKTKEPKKIVEELNSKERFEELGLSLIREFLSTKGNQEEAIIAVLLIEALFEESLKQIALGTSVFHLKAGLEKGGEKALALLEKQAFTLNNLQALVSKMTKQEAKIVPLFIEALEKKGKIQFKKSPLPFFFSEKEEGMSFEIGYASSYFATESKMETILEETTMFFLDQPLYTALDAVHVLKENQTSFIVITRNLGKEALETFILHQLKKEIPFSVIEVPGASVDEKANTLKDWALQLKAVPFIKGSLSGWKKEAKKVKISEKRTTVILEKIEEETTIFYLTQEQMEWIPFLSKIQSALCKGAVLGEGLAFIQVAKELSPSFLADQEKQKGVDVLKKALFAPATLLAKKGEERAIKALAQLTLKGNSCNENFELADLIEEGVIDSLIGAKEVLAGAISFTTMLLTISSTFIDKKRKENISVEEERGDER